MSLQPAAPKGRALIDHALRAFEARDLNGAAVHLRALIDENPALGETWGSVARLASLIGEASLAVTAAKRLVRDAPGDRDRRLAAGSILAAHGRVEEALAEVSAALVRYPDDPALLHFVGTCQAQLGRKEEALRSLRRSLSLQRTAAAAMTWLTLMDLKSFEAGDPDMDHLYRLVVALNGVDEMQGAALYALGKARDDIDDVDRAFDAISHGAALIARKRPYDGAVSHALVDRMIAGAGADHQSVLPSGLDSDRPIFVLGAPRSGSTLVEQMLVSHPDVSGGGELNLFRHAALRLGSMAPDEQARVARSASGDEVWRAMGEHYLHLLDNRFGDQGRIVDKTLSHTRIVGLLASVFPKARFVWLRRDPAATAWSCLKTYFNEGLDWTWSQTEIAAYLRDEDRLHAHWTSVLPDAILTVPYEALVNDPDTWTPRILAHCGLTDDPAVRAFHTTQRAVQTASVSQVRRPLYTKAVEDWRRYERHLQPFIQAYERG